MKELLLYFICFQLVQGLIIYKSDNNLTFQHDSTGVVHCSLNGWNYNAWGSNISISNIEYIIVGDQPTFTIKFVYDVINASNNDSSNYDYVEETYICENYFCHHNFNFNFNITSCYILFRENVSLTLDILMIESYINDTHTNTYSNNNNNSNNNNSNNSNNNNNSNNSNNNNSNNYIIIGISVGLVLVIILAIVLVIFVKKKWHQNYVVQT